MFVIKYIVGKDQASYSHEEDIARINLAPNYSSLRKATSFLEKKVLINGRVPDKFDSIQVLEVASGVGMTRKNYYKT